MGLLLALYTAAIFLSALLLFLVQPLTTRLALPLLGSSPAVWNTAVVFFQAMLLAGYLYAHLVSTRLRMRAQLAVHGTLLVGALVTLPIAIPDGWRPPVAGSPIPWLLGMLAVMVGLPFFLLSTTSPLLQAWFARTRHPSAHDPYFLYAAGNAGSLLALLSYPFLIEPRLRLAAQAEIWAIAFAGLALLLAGCAATVWRSAPAEAEQARPDRAVAETASGPVTHWRRLLWVVWSAIPSSLMLSVTSYLSVDVPSIPLLWVVPLAIYLLTFTIAFAGWARLVVRAARLALPVALLALGLNMTVGPIDSAPLLVGLHLLTLLLAALVCHASLAADRPSARELTGFYVWLSVGGVAGGGFTALFAPVLFDGVIEYAAVLALLALMLAVGPAPIRRLERVWHALATLPAAGVLIAAVVTEIRAGGRTPEPADLVLMLCLALATAVIAARRPIAAGLGMAALVAAMLLARPLEFEVLSAERSFFGVSRVMVDRDGGYYRFMNGSTLHGMQSLDPERRREPITYYSRAGPIGQVLTALNARGSLARVGVVGLGAGTLACYRQPGQTWTFFEIDPAVERIARNGRYFTYLADCAPDAEVVLGDARLSLAQTDDRFDLIVLDAYSSDAIPMHLLTREALALYEQRLTDRGLLAFHISNRYLDLEPVLAALVEDAGLAAVLQAHGAEPEQGVFGSVWVMVGRSPDSLAAFATDGRWQPLEVQAGIGVWTDDFSSVLSVLRW